MPAAPATALHAQVLRQHLCDPTPAGAPAVAHAPLADRQRQEEIKPRSLASWSFPSSSKSGIQHPGKCVITKKGWSSAEFPQSIKLGIMT